MKRIYFVSLFVLLYLGAKASVSFAIYPVFYAAVQVALKIALLLVMQS